MHFAVNFLCLCIGIHAAYKERLDIEPVGKRIKFHWEFTGHDNLLVSDLVSKWDIKALNLTLTQGVYHTAPTGLQLLANASNFKGLVHDLSGNYNLHAGLFCASMNFINEKNTAKLNGLFYASLPREIVCTENLTPWSKLLPCSSQAGLASLFNAYKLYDSNFHSLGFGIRHTDGIVEIIQTLTIITDPVRILGSIG